MKHNFAYIKSQCGMSLIGVMVAAGIGLIVMFGMTSMITDVFKSQRSVQSRDAGRELVASIRQLLSDPNNCKKTFSGSDPHATGFSKTQILDATGVVKYQTGINYLNGLVAINSFDLKNYTADNAGAPLVGKAELDIRMDKVGSNIGGSLILTKIYLQVVLDVSNNIVQCNALGSADSLWQSSSVNLSDIFYAGGNVGIGVSNPTTTLEVAGGVKPGDQTQVTVCNSASEGTQRYNRVTHAMEYCGASGSGSPLIYAWTPMGGAVPANVPVTVTGANPTCPAGRTAIVSLWTPNSCGSVHSSPCGQIGGCTTPAQDLGLTAPTCSYYAGCQNYGGSWHLTLPQACTATSRTQVLCM